MENTSLSDPFLSNEACIERLVNEWEKYKMLIIAYDFDNTVFDYYGKGYTFNDVVNLLRQCKKLGFHLTLFTSCNDDRIEEIKQYLSKNDIPFDSINETPDNIPFRGRKVYYNHFLDDRAGLKSAYEILCETVFRIKMKIREKETEHRQDIDF